MFYKYDNNFQATVLSILVDFSFPSLCYVRQPSHNKQSFSINEGICH